jgi:hypothetical protein
MAKYDSLETYLRDLPNKSVRLTFDEINRILPSPLPRSAYDHPPFWSNTTVGSTHVWADAWHRISRIGTAPLREREEQFARPEYPRVRSSGIVIANRRAELARYVLKIGDLIDEAPLVPDELRVVIVLTAADMVFQQHQADRIGKLGLLFLTFCERCKRVAGTVSTV